MFRSRTGRKPVLGTRVNWSHPLAKGLVGVWLLNEGNEGKGGIMFVAKSRIENFSDCRVGDILYEDGDDEAYDWKLYTDHNRTVAKLKTKAICPGGLVASIEEKGLNLQTISVFDDSRLYGTSGSSTVSGSGYGSPFLTGQPQSSSVPNKTTLVPPYSGAVLAKHMMSTSTKPPKKKTPVTMGKFVGNCIGKIIRKVR